MRTQNIRIPVLTRNQALTLIILVAVVVRVSSVLYLGAQMINFGDGPDNLQAAIQLCQSSSYPQESSLPFFRAPGLPFFLSFITGCNPQLVFIDKLALIVADCFSVLMIALIAARVWRDKSLAIPAATLAAFYPPFIAQVTDIQSEPLFMALMLGSIFFLLDSSNSRWRQLVSGALLGLAALTRPIGLVFLPLFCINALLIPSAKNRLGGTLLILCGFLLTVAPWVARNAFVYNELILVNDAAGYNFWRGAHPEMRAIYQARTLDEFTDKQQHFESITSPTVAAEVAANNASPGKRSAKWRELGFEIVTQDPRGYFKFLIQKALIFWRPWLNPTIYPAPKVILSALIFVPTLMLGLIGLTWLRHHNRRLFWSCVLFLGISWIAHIPFQTVTRFRIPLVDPVCLILGVQPLMALVNRKRGPEF